MITIGTINLTEVSEVIFYIDTYRGRQFGNIRKFIKSKKYTGSTKSGIKLNKKELQGIYEALKNVSSEITTLQECELRKIPIYKGKFILVRLSYFEGFYGIDIREYFETKKYCGPSKRGIRIPFEYLNDIIKELISRKASELKAQF